MKHRLTIRVFAILISGLFTGCIGFWTAVGTIYYMKSGKHETVTVQIKSPADQVYTAMLSAIKKNGATIKKSKESKYLVEGVRDGINASGRAEDAGNGITQLIVTVDAGKDNESGEEAFAMKIVENICAEIGEDCKLNPE